MTTVGPEVHTPPGDVGRDEVVEEPEELDDEELEEPDDGLDDADVLLEELLGADEVEVEVEVEVEAGEVVLVPPPPVEPLHPVSAPATSTTEATTHRPRVPVMARSLLPAHEHAAGAPVRAGPLVPTSRRPRPPAAGDLGPCGGSGGRTRLEVSGIGRSVHVSRTGGPAMSDIERARARKEAADAVTSQPPTEGESRLQAALRRYLGTSLSSTLRSRDRRSPDDKR